MTVMVHSSTTSPFGFLGTLPPLFRRVSESGINADLLDKEIRTVLREWDLYASASDNLIVAETGPLHAAISPALKYPSDPVEAVQYIGSMLQLPQERVLEAVGVKERTFFGWKTQLRRPRTTSLGRLWAAVEALRYLAGSHPNLAAWFHTSSEAQRSFANGDIDGLLQLELDWALRTYRAPAPVDIDFGDSAGSPARQPDSRPAPRRSFRSAPVNGASLTRGQHDS